MTLLPNDDTVAKEIQSWETFADGLRGEDRKLFRHMLRQCYRHIKAINTKGSIFSTESLLMALLLEQQKLIDFLIARLKSKV